MKLRLSDHCRKETVRSCLYNEDMIDFIELVTWESADETHRGLNYKGACVPASERLMSPTDVLRRGLNYLAPRIREAKRHLKLSLNHFKLCETQLKVSRNFAGNFIALSPIMKFRGEVPGTKFGTNVQLQAFKI